MANPQENFNSVVKLNEITKQQFHDLGHIIDPGISNNLFEFTGNFIFHLAPFTLMFAVIALAYSWIQYYNQGLDQIAIDMGKKAIFWIIISGIALSGHNYIHLAHVIFHAPEEIAQWFTTDKGDLNAGYFDIAVQPINRILRQIDKFYDTLAWSALSDKMKTLVMYYIIKFLGLGFIAIAFALYIINKLLLAVTLMVGPFFIVCGFFAPTRQWMMNWIGSTLSYILTIVFYILITLIFVNYLRNYLMSSINTNNVIFDFAFFETILSHMFITCVIFLIGLLKLPSVASALTGGASIEGAISGAVRAITMVKTGGMSSLRAANSSRSSVMAARGAGALYNRFRNNSIKPGDK